MNKDLLRVVEAFAGLRVMVIGEAMLDAYVHGTVSRLCREAPVPIVAVTGQKAVPGGAANTAANVSNLGAHCEFVSVLGNDGDGDLLQRSLQERHVSTSYLVRFPTRRTLVKRRIVGASQMLLRVDEGTTEAITGDAEAQVVSHLTDAYKQCDVVIVSDYRYGILTPRVIRAIAECQARHPRLLVVDSKMSGLYRGIGVTAVKPNYDEAMRLLGVRSDDHNGQNRVDYVATQGERILHLTGAEIAAVTLDRDGAIVFERGNPPYRTYAKPMPDSHAVGAGDTFVSALALSLATGAHTPTAAEIASSAAAVVVVSKDGTVSCSADQLKGYLAGLERYIASIDRLIPHLALYRQHGKRIVFTSGCFDILHRGHITHLNAAKELGDILIVGVNGDESVRRLKGQGRPITSLEDRIQVLAALSCIDHIIPFDEDTPSNLIRAIRPDVFVKGGNHTRDSLPEAPLVELLGGRVQILPYVESHSTTSIIERIRATPEMEEPMIARLPGQVVKEMT